MNSKKSGFIKLLSFSILAVILISVISFAVSGWQSIPEGNEAPPSDSDNTVTLIPDGENSETTEEKYYNVMTGLEVTEEIFLASPISYLVNADSAVYGLSSADLTIEFPTEQNDSRLLFYSLSTDLWRIGALSYTRGYIDSFASAIGIPYVNLGYDGTNVDGESHLSDLSVNAIKNGLAYKDNSKFFTTAELLSGAIGEDYSAAYSTPIFNFGSGNLLSSVKAESIIIPYSNKNETELYYSKETGLYTYYKSGVKVIDMLNGNSIEYKNIFILFADSTTYESADGAELVMDTKSGGRGYYISEGERLEINWRIDENGKYVFTTASGEVLNVNCGTSYITFYKSYLSGNIITK